MKYQRLRDLREDHDLTQDQLVEILHMPKTTYTNYEQGKREIPFCLAIRLAELYNVSLDFIAGLTNEPRPLNNPISRFICKYANSPEMYPGEGNAHVAAADYI